MNTIIINKQLAELGIEAGTDVDFNHPPKTALGVLLGLKALCLIAGRDERLRRCMKKMRRVQGVFVHYQTHGAELLSVVKKQIELKKYLLCVDELYDLIYDGRPVFRYIA